MAHNEFHRAAYQLATEFYAKPGAKVCAGVEFACDQIAEHFRQPEFANREVTLGEMAEWFLEQRLNKLRSYRAPNHTGA